MGLEDDISDIKSKLKELSLRRSSIKGQLTKFKNYLVTLESIQLSSIQVAELSLKVKKIELLSTTFDKIQNEVEIINHTNLEYELTERDIIESDIITCIAKANSFIEEASIHSESPGEGYKKILYQDVLKPRGKERYRGRTNKKHRTWFPQENSFPE
ncbi:hypothetical protein ACJJTC_018374 [Scirpophaga incertulas]